MSTSLNQTYCKLLLLIQLIITLCFGDISCDFGYIRSKTFVWNTTITSCIHPSSDQEIIDVITKAVTQNENRNATTVRAIGASLSYSAVGMLDEINFDAKQPQNVIVINTTTNLNQVINLNFNDMSITVESGIRYIDLIDYLLENNASIRYASGGTTFANFVGTFSTGTHGGGIPNKGTPVMARNIIGLKMVIGNGSLITINQTYNKHLLNAVLISFGSLGIITEITVQIQHGIPLIQQETIVYDNFSNFRDINDTFYNQMVPIYNNYFRVLPRWRIPYEYWQLNTYTMLNESNITLKEENSCWSSNKNDIICSDVYYKAMTEPTLEYAIVGNRKIQTEWFIPVYYYQLATMDVIQYVYQQKIDNTSLWKDTYNYAFNENKFNEWYFSFHFIEGDNIWMSPAGYDNNTDVMCISLHLPERIPTYLSRQWQMNLYDILKKKYSPVRMHWGKISMTSYCDLQDSYPELNDFINLRQEFDPYNIFLNSFTRDKLGLCNMANKCCCTGVSCFKSTDSDKDEMDIWFIVGIVGIVVFILIVLFIVILCGYRWKKRRNTSKTQYQHELSQLIT
eukprot:542497_1